ncbi:MAG: ShlB/FhaC/HecB family hemolysin secretion/activation protein, partial [Burkholderiales bacterium]
MVAWLTCQVLVAGAQTAPVQDPIDRLLREQQDKIRLERLQQQTPEVAVPKESIVDADAAPDSIADADPTFAIEQVILKGLEEHRDILSIADERRLVAPFEGKRLGVNRINLLLKRLTQAFIDRGWITTRAYIGNQNLASRILELTVVPGRIEKLVYNGGNLPPTAWNKPGVRLAFPDKQGQLLNLTDLEQGIDQLNRLRRNHAELRTEPGDTPGGSVVAIENKDTERFYYSLGVDNYGSDTSGRTRYRAGVEADNLLGLQEMLGLSYVGSLDTNALLFSSSLPWGYNTFNYTYSYSEFQDLIGDSALLFGRSEGHTLAWNRILSRSRLGKSGMDVSLSARKAEREINNFELLPQRLTVARLGFNKLRRFEWSTVPGFWTADAGYVRGLNVIGATDDPSDLPRDGAHAQFGKIDVSGSLAAQFGRSFAYRGALNGQWTRNALFSSEQIFAGGASSVRGFSES